MIAPGGFKEFRASSRAKVEGMNHGDTEARRRARRAGAMRRDDVTQDAIIDCVLRREFW